MLREMWVDRTDYRHTRAGGRGDLPDTRSQGEILVAHRQVCHDGEQRDLRGVGRHVRLLAVLSHGGRPLGQGDGVGYRRGGCQSRVDAYLRRASACTGFSRWVVMW